jgi:FtsH-binding integral membrane protein
VSNNSPIMVQSSAASIPLSRDDARTVFGQVMGLVALTLGCLALGAYIGRDLSGGWGILFFIAGFACIFGLNVASTRGNEQLAITLLFGLGLLLGLALGPVLSSYVEADPAPVWQAAGATGAFVASLGAVGYATRRDLSSWYRVLFWALLGLLVFGLVAIFVSIPNANLIWSATASRSGDQGGDQGLSRARRADESGRLRALPRTGDSHVCHHRQASGRSRDPPVPS